MAVLSDQDRFSVWADWMRKNMDNISITKSELRAAVDALDDFMNTNAAVINSAIPQPARGSLTTAQKAAILSFVVMKRYTSGA